MRLFVKISIVLLIPTLIFLFGINSCSYSTKEAQKFLAESQDKTYDIIIVPGVPFEGENWDTVMKIRVYWSKYLFDKGITKNVMYSGSAVYSPYYEAEIMALYAEKLGIPKENIFTETEAEHSTENVYYSFKKARKLGFKRIALATDPFQSKMVANFIKKKMKVNLPMVPIVYDTLKALNPAMYDPQIDYKKAYDDSFVSIKEREGFWKRFNGTRGYNIDTTLYEP